MPSDAKRKATHPQGHHAASALQQPASRPLVLPGRGAVQWPNFPPPHVCPPKPLPQDEVPSMPPAAKAQRTSRGSAAAQHSTSAHDSVYSGMHKSTLHARTHPGTSLQPQRSTSATPGGVHLPRTATHTAGNHSTGTSAMARSPSGMLPAEWLRDSDAVMDIVPQAADPCGKNFHTTRGLAPQAHASAGTGSMQLDARFSPSGHMELPQPDPHNWLLSSNSTLSRMPTAYMQPSMDASGGVPSPGAAAGAQSGAQSGSAPAPLPHGAVRGPDGVVWCPVFAAQQQPDWASQPPPLWQHAESTVCGGEQPHWRQTQPLGASVPPGCQFLAAVPGYSPSSGGVANHQAPPLPQHLQSTSASRQALQAAGPCDTHQRQQQLQQPPPRPPPGGRTGAAPCAGIASTPLSATAGDGSNSMLPVGHMPGRASAQAANAADSSLELGLLWRTMQSPTPTPADNSVIDRAGSGKLVYADGSGGGGGGSGSGGAARPQSTPNVSDMLASHDLDALLNLGDL